MKEKNEEILNHYGVQKQMIIWLEELSELQKCICKWSRNYDKWKGNITDKPREEFIGEIADVENSIEQMMLAINTQKTEIWNMQLYKSDRQLKRIEEEK